MVGHNWIYIQVRALVTWLAHKRPAQWFYFTSSRYYNVLSSKTFLPSQRVGQFFSSVPPRHLSFPIFIFHLLHLSFVQNNQQKSLYQLYPAQQPPIGPLTRGSSAHFSICSAVKSWRRLLMSCDSTFKTRCDGFLLTLGRQQILWHCCRDKNFRSSISLGGKTTAVNLFSWTEGKALQQFRTKQVHQVLSGALTMSKSCDKNVCVSFLFRISSDWRYVRYFTSRVLGVFNCRWQRKVWSLHWHVHSQSRVFWDTSLPSCSYVPRRTHVSPGNQRKLFA